MLKSIIMIFRSIHFFKKSHTPVNTKANAQNFVSQSILSPRPKDDQRRNKLDIPNLSLLI